MTVKGAGIELLGYLCPSSSESLIRPAQVREARDLDLRKPLVLSSSNPLVLSDLTFCNTSVVT